MSYLFRLSITAMLTLSLAGVAFASTSTIGGPGIGNGTFGIAGAVAVDSSGNLFVLDPSRGKLSRFTNTGFFLDSVTSANGTALGYATGIAIDSGDHVFVAAGDRLVEFDTSLGYVSTLATGAAFVSVGAGGGHVYGLLDTGTGQYEIRRYTGGAQDMNLVFPIGSDVGELAAPNSNGAIRDQVTVAPSGIVYVTDTDNQRVIELDSSLTPQSQTLTGFTGYPQAIGAGTAGGATQIYVGDDDYSAFAAVRRFGTSGSQLGSLAVQSAHGGIAQDSAGDVFVGGGCSGCAVTRIDTRPDVVLAADPASGLSSQTVTFDGSASRVDLWGVSSFAFDLDGSNAFATSGSPTATRRFDAPGSYPIHLRITGTNGRSSETGILYAVGASSAAFTGPASALTAASVTFDASPSQIAHSTITDFAWDVDGSSTYANSTGTNPAFAHTFTAPGTYTVQLRVTRDGGRVDFAESTIRIAPAPPPGVVGVSINNGDAATNNARVALSMVWPALAGTALVSNDGGFASRGSFDVAPTIPWTLASSGSERLPKTVYVRFLGAGADNVPYTDDIILDQRPPTVGSASATPAAASTAVASRLRAYRVKLRAADDNSGVAGMQARGKKGKAVQVVFVKRTKRGPKSLRKVVKVRLASAPARVRVRDSAGNWSKWRRLKKSGIAR